MLKGVLAGVWQGGQIACGRRRRSKASCSILWTVIAIGLALAVGFGMFARSFYLSNLDEARNVYSLSERVLHELGSEWSLGVLKKYGSKAYLSRNSDTELQRGLNKSKVRYRKVTAVEIVSIDTIQRGFFLKKGSVMRTKSYALLEATKRRARCTLSLVNQDGKWAVDHVVLADSKRDDQDMRREDMTSPQ